MKNRPQDKKPFSQIKKIKEHEIVRNRIAWFILPPALSLKNESKSERQSHDSLLKWNCMKWFTNDLYQREGKNEVNPTVWKTGRRLRHLCFFQANEAVENCPCKWRATVGISQRRRRPFFWWACCGEGGEDSLLNHKSESWIYFLPLRTAWLYRNNIFKCEFSFTHQRSTERGMRFTWGDTFISVLKASRCTKPLK